MVPAPWPSAAMPQGLRLGSPVAMLQGLLGMLVAPLAMAQGRQLLGPRCAPVPLAARPEGSPSSCGRVGGQPNSRRLDTFR